MSDKISQNHQMNFKQSGKKKNECSKCYKLNKKGGCC